MSAFSRSSLRSIIAYIIILSFISCSRKKQTDIKDIYGEEISTDVYANRSIKDALSIVAYRQLKELTDGDYIHASWEQVLDSKPPSGILWRYPQGVTLYGLLYANEKIFHDPKILEYVTKHNDIAARQFEYLTWQIMMYGKYTNDASMADLIKLFMLDHCGSITNQILESILRHSVEPTPPLRAVIDRVAEYIAHRQNRLPNGVFWRPEAKEGTTLWIDDLYMGCPFLVRWYQYTGDRIFLEDAVHQIIRFASYTQDDDGLWYHGYFFKENEPAPYKWSRANGWAMVATVEVLSAMPMDHPDRDKLISILKKHIDGLIPLQAESGRWRQILDHHELWEETSSTAMFTYGIARAVNRGWIEKDYLRIAIKAFEGINSRITADGAITGTSEGTGLRRELDYYVTRKRPLDDNHGIGPVLLALTELLIATNSN